MDNLGSTPSSKVYPFAKHTLIVQDTSTLGMRRLCIQPMAGGETTQAEDQDSG